MGNPQFKNILDTMTNESASLLFCLWGLFSLGRDTYEAIKKKKTTENQPNQTTPNPHISITVDSSVTVDRCSPSY